MQPIGAPVPSNASADSGGHTYWQNPSSPHVFARKSPSEFHALGPSPDADALGIGMYASSCVSASQSSPCVSTVHAGPHAFALSGIANDPRHRDPSTQSSSLSHGSPSGVSPGTPPPVSSPDSPASSVMPPSSPPPVANKVEPEPPASSPPHAAK